jgi:FMN-dependent NADH-azoreductase
MTDVQFVYAEGLALGEQQRESALAHARATIEDLADAEAFA